MRIANKSVQKPLSGSLSKRVSADMRVALLLALGAMPFVPGTGAYAADPALPLIAQTPALIPAPSQPAVVPLALPAPPALSSPNETTPGGAMNKNATAMENKVSESAKNVVKKLEGGSDAMTLEEVNSARQTVSRIEAMIDVEKHLAELDKIRNDRKAKATESTPLVNAIPASALMPPPAPAANSIVFTPPPRPVHIEKPKVSAAEISVLRVTGSDGKYSATLKFGDGKVRSVRAGDRIDDLITIEKIEPLCVVIVEKGQSRTVHIKNVEAIYSATR